MELNGAKFFVGVAFLLALALALTTNPLRAQDAGATVNGRVTDSSGNPVANTIVVIRNSVTGASTEAQTDAAGMYSVPGLAAGDYEVSASAEGIGSNASKITLAAASQQTVNLGLTPTPPPAPPAPPPPQNLPDAPSSSKTETAPSQPSLEDLGFSKSEQQSNLQQQMLLDKRTHMLKIHQRMGLITTIPLVATVILGPGAGGKSEGTAARDLHVALGALTGDLYGITAYYAIRAPRIKGTEKRGPIRFHEAMAWIHGPGMILTPILGAMAFSQKNNGEKVHGIAQAHGPVAIVTAGAFGAALISVSMKC
jgi:hypothetical protein